MLRQRLPAPAAPVAEPGEELHIVKSPIVGTYYGSPSPGAAPFIAPGDHVDKGQVICIVEAMKLMNEIESDAAGEIVKCLVTNGQPIEFGQKPAVFDTGGVSRRTDFLESGEFALGSVPSAAKAEPFSSASSRTG